MDQLTLTIFKCGDLEHRQLTVIEHSASGGHDFNLYSSLSINYRPNHPLLKAFLKAQVYVL